jgi:AhpD family alkylhydroperoxidase
MQARMKNPAVILPETLQTLLAVSASIKGRGVSENTMDLVHLRVSQINGCSVCTDMGFRKLQKEGETIERMVGVSAWREMPYFSEAERAALALGEAMTRLADRPEAVSDEIWIETIKADSAFSS